MARVQVIVALGLLGSVAVAGVAVAPRVDARWQSAKVEAQPYLLENLARSDRAPLLFVPRSVTDDPTRPVTLVVVLPGLGQNGRDLAEKFVPAAEAFRWLLLAPSPDYDPRDTNETLVSADLRIDDEIVSLVDQVVDRASYHVASAVDLIGFSRGAQSAHRFALRHPSRVAALASFSAGTYTMPTRSEPYPLGMRGFELWNHGQAFDVQAMRQVRVLVGVGELDANQADVARAWDAVGGLTRVDRGVHFAQAMMQLGVPYHFLSYPGVSHTFAPAMRDDAVAWFRG